MKALTTDELRELYLSYFAEKGHERLPGASLVPAKDPTLLLTSAGMVPFKPYFLGLETPKHSRVTTCQRCLRTGDIHNVGQTDRHHTFFEMLGNFSFGDYFKREAIAFAWEFVTERLELPSDRLWASIYLEDDEAYEIWRREIGLPHERIVRLGKEDNFWEIGVGPCGPCSEIYFDKGPEHGCGGEHCAPGCDDCERYLEIWNLVFIQFHQDEKGELTPLKSQGVDTGMGLERTASVLQGVKSTFDIDIIRPLTDFVADLAGAAYGKDPADDVSLRVITDHMRGVALMVHDGILPGNEGRGYVLRRLLRRSVRHGRLLGVQGAFLTRVVDRVIDLLKHGYPELIDSREYVKNVVAVEEARFQETLDQGMDMLERLTADLARSGGTTLSGEDAFSLYDTYGFPVELTEEILAAKGLSLDKAGFDEAMEAQRARARAARATMGYMGDSVANYAEMDLGAEPTAFVGYETTQGEAVVAAMVYQGEAVGRVDQGDVVEVFLDSTPFYPEGGGQVADKGTIRGDNGLVAVEDVAKVSGERIVHRGRVISGSLQVGDKVVATVDSDDRRATQRNHTGTHLLHKALQEVLGNHAKQAGSLVEPDRLRFDFTHFKALTKDEVREIERRVNEKIMDNLPVTAALMTYDEAVDGGATALFGEKYADQVRVVSIGDYSKELCGGTHVRQSGDIGFFKVVSEGGVASGVRRIEAVTGDAAVLRAASSDDALQAIAEQLQSPVEEAPRQLERLLSALKEKDREIARLKGRLAQAQVASMVSRAVDCDGVHVLTAAVEGFDMDGLMTLADRLKEQLGTAAVVLGAATGNQVHLVGMATDEAVQHGVHVGDAVREAAKLLGGGGGGNAKKAQGGGKDAARLKEALDVANSALMARLRGRAARQA